MNTDIQDVIESIVTAGRGYAPRGFARPVNTSAQLRVFLGSQEVEAYTMDDLVGPCAALWDEYDAAGKVAYSSSWKD